jgi:hypothetical protein
VTEIEINKMGKVGRQRDCGKKNAYKIFVRKTKFCVPLNGLNTDGLQNSDELLNCVAETEFKYY